MPYTALYANRFVALSFYHGSIMPVKVRREGEFQQPTRTVFINRSWISWQMLSLASKNAALSDRMGCKQRVILPEDRLAFLPAFVEIQNSLVAAALKAQRDILFIDQKGTVHQYIHVG